MLWYWSNILLFSSQCATVYFVVLGVHSPGRFEWISEKVALCWGLSGWTAGSATRLHSWTRRSHGWGHAGWTGSLHAGILAWREACRWTSGLSRGANWSYVRVYVRSRVVLAGWPLSVVISRALLARRSVVVRRGEVSVLWWPLRFALQIHLFELHAELVIVDTGSRDIWIALDDLHGGSEARDQVAQLLSTFGDGGWFAEESRNLSVGADTHPEV